MGTTPDDKLALSAYRMWAAVSEKGESIRTLYEFADYLGDPWFGDRDHIIDMTNPEVRRRVEQLAGPNGYTMAKAMLANKEPRK